MIRSSPRPSPRAQGRATRAISRHPIAIILTEWVARSERSDGRGLLRLPFGLSKTVLHNLQVSLPSFVKNMHSDQEQLSGTEFPRLQDCIPGSSMKPRLPAGIIWMSPSAGGDASGKARSTVRGATRRGSSSTPPRHFFWIRLVLPPLRLLSFRQRSGVRRFWLGERLARQVFRSLRRPR